MVLSSADIFFKISLFVVGFLLLFFFFKKKSFGNISRVSNSFVEPDLVPNCLQRLSADDTSK